MGKYVGTCRRAFALALILLAITGCAQADTARKRFDIDAQPAAGGLNEFARQADITLFFSYDLVAAARTSALKGYYTVDSGLARLLAGTGFGYQQVGDDAFLICRPSSCEPSHGVEVEARQAWMPIPGSGKDHQPRLNDIPATRRRTPEHIPGEGPICEAILWAAGSGAKFSAMP